MPRKLLEMAASIVKAQVVVGGIPAEEVEQALKKVFLALQRLQNAEQHGIMFERADERGGPALSEKVLQPSSPKDSIRENTIMCLECGSEMRQLTSRHLGMHELTPQEYKKKWGLPLRTSLAAKSLSRARSRAAKKRGLPENLVKFLQERQHKAAEEESNPPPALS
jgi:predicted transcriptional regulator